MALAGWSDGRVPDLRVLRVRAKGLAMTCPVGAGLASLVAIALAIAMAVQVPPRAAYAIDARFYDFASTPPAAILDEVAVERLLHDHPLDLRCAAWLELIVDSRKVGGEIPQIHQAMRRFLAYTQPAGPWAAAVGRQGAVGAEALAVAGGLAENYLLYLANYSHQIAQKAEQESDLAHALPYYRAAAQDYTIFLKRFPHAKKAPLVGFYLGEIQLDLLEDFPAAAEAFSVYLAGNPTGEFEEDAGLGVMHAWEKQMAVTRARWNAAKRRWIADPRGAPILELPATPMQLKRASWDTAKRPWIADPQATAHLGLPATPPGTASRTGDLVEARLRFSPPIPHMDLHPMEKSWMGACDGYVARMQAAALRCEAARRVDRSAVDCRKGRHMFEAMVLAAERLAARGHAAEAVTRFEEVQRHLPARVGEFAAMEEVHLLAAMGEWQGAEVVLRRQLSIQPKIVVSQEDLRQYLAVTVAMQVLTLAKRNLAAAGQRYCDLALEFGPALDELAKTNLIREPLWATVRGQRQRCGL